jgi:large subunit ribosomal protein L23
MRNVYDVIKRPIISEKSSALSEVAGKYVFEVSMASNKYEVRSAVEELFKVGVKSVHTMIMHGEYKRTQRAVLKKSNWKKAIVTLKDGQKIDFFQN